MTITTVLPLRDARSLRFELLTFRLYLYDKSFWTDSACLSLIRTKGIQTNVIERMLKGPNRIGSGCRGQATDFVFQRRSPSTSSSTPRACRFKRCNVRARR